MRPTFAEFTFSYFLTDHPDPEIVRLTEQLAPFKPGVRRFQAFIEGVAERPNLPPELWKLETLEKIWACYRSWCGLVMELRSEPLFRELMKRR